MTSGGESERLFDAYSIPSPARPLFHTSLVPDVATWANYKLYGESTAVTDLKQFADRCHPLTIDDRWRQGADFVLGWLTGRGISGSARSESGLQ
jgi:hypothetical protein